MVGSAGAGGTAAGNKRLRRAAAKRRHLTLPEAFLQVRAMQKRERNTNVPRQGSV